MKQKSMGKEKKKRDGLHALYSNMGVKQSTHKRQFHTLHLHLAKSHLIINSFVTLALIRQYIHDRKASLSPLPKPPQNP